MALSAASVDSGGATANSLNVRIGAMYWTDSYHQGNDRLNGKADEMGFFKRALGCRGDRSDLQRRHAREMQALCPPTLRNLVSWWKGIIMEQHLVRDKRRRADERGAMAPGKVGQALALMGWTVLLKCRMQRPST